MSRQRTPSRARAQPAGAARTRATAQLTLRRELRRAQTEAERRLWYVLRGRRLGAKFRRQHSVGPYVVDFYCAEHRLAVELDGGQHLRGEEPARDARRTEYLGACGVRVVRFTNRAWFGDPDEVIRVILEAIGRRG